MFESGVYTSFHGQIVPFYSQIVPQFQCRTRCEALFLLACKLKERGIHISNFLVLLVALKLVKSSDYIVEWSALERSDWIANYITWVHEGYPSFLANPQLSRMSPFPLFLPLQMPATKAEDLRLIFTSDGVAVTVGVVRRLWLSENQKWES